MLCFVYRVESVYLVKCPVREERGCSLFFSGWRGGIKVLSGTGFLLGELLLLLIAFI